MGNRKEMGSGTFQKPQEKLPKNKRPWKCLNGTCPRSRKPWLLRAELGAGHDRHDRRCPDCNSRAERVVPAKPREPEKMKFFCSRDGECPHADLSNPVLLDRRDVQNDDFSIDCPNCGSASLEPATAHCMPQGLTAGLPKSA
jgi:Zn finger protein HypA/HybF involved in hydrogenase expression